MAEQFDKFCIDLIEIEKESCSDCGEPATHFISIDLGFQTASLGDLLFCQECGQEVVDRWRKILPAPSEESS